MVFEPMRVGATLEPSTIYVMNTIEISCLLSLGCFDHRHDPRLYRPRQRRPSIDHTAQIRGIRTGYATSCTGFRTDIPYGVS